MKLSINGYTASGKSYQSKILAERFNLEYISGSDILLKFGNLSPSEEHFWINKQSINFNKKRFEDPTIDKKTDETILKLAEEKDNVIFDSWSLPWLYSKNDLYKIYLSANLETRIKIAYESREQKPLTINEIKIGIQKKDMETRDIFLKLYGFDIKDNSVYDLIIDNSNLSPEETSQRLISEITNTFTKN